MLFLLLGPHAAAATLVVDSSGSGGAYTTVQAAVQAASSGDTISIRAGTYSGLVDTAGKDLVLAGATASTVVLEGAADEILNVDQGESVTVRDLTLRGSGQGAAIRASTAAFTGVVISGNTGVVAGGGVGVYDGAVVTMTSCVVQDNTVTGAYNGGGVFVDSSTLLLDGVTVRRNSANQGGGVYASGSTVTITDSTLADNAAASHGGGIRIRNGGSLTADTVTVSGNTAGSRGGGVSVVSVDTTWSASEVRDNVSVAAGGGMHLDGMGLTGTQFEGAVTGNEAGGSGGGLFLNSHDLSLTGTLASNLAPASTDGVGLHALDSQVSLTDATVEDHSGMDGAGLYLFAGSALSLERTTLNGNTAAGQGGALFLEGSLTASDTTFSMNIATGAGGGAWVDGGDVSLDNVEFLTNVAGAASGGGGLLVRSAGLTATATAFEDNRSGYGGGLALLGSGLEDHSLQSTTFRRNLAAADGGGMFLSDAATLLLAATLFQDNEAAVSGGGAAVDDVGSLIARWTNWLGNTADVGGGLAATGLSGGRTIHNAFATNRARSAAGARFGAPAGPYVITNVRFYENQGDGLVLSGDTAGELRVLNIDASGNTGAGVSVSSSPRASVSSSIAAFNGGAGFSADSISASTVDLSWSTSHGNGIDWGGALPSMTGTNGNLDTDPLYAALTVDGNATGDVLLLSSGSPCRDAGDPARSDPDGSRADMGSYGGPSATDSDLDGDGHSLSDGDCDDTDPTVHPGATEAWYDGIDQDCAGGDDWDADLDGYRSRLHPSGNDCDDAAADVHPGAPDEDGDGIDQDCDGADGTAAGTGGGDDGGTGGGGDTGAAAEDFDRDGFPAGEDCNDAEPAAFPGNPEDCSDGVDNDCDGYTDDLDAECLPKDSSGCAVGGTTRSTSLLAGLLAMALSGRRRPRPRPSSGR